MKLFRTSHPIYLDISYCFFSRSVYLACQQVLLHRFVSQGCLVTVEKD